MRDGSRFRVRCYITGELFLAAALASGLGGVGVISIGWTWIGIGVVYVVRSSQTLGRFFLGRVLTPVFG